MREERDSLGLVQVPAEKYWGAQTQRSLTYFSIGDERMPLPVIHAYGLLKIAAARANCDLGLLSPERRDLIVTAAQEVADGQLDAHFPLHVWMTGSGTQTNMNVNEVIANRAIELAGGVLGSKDPIHPNDHVNLSQSSNDSFPTAMHMAAAREVTAQLLPAIRRLRDALAENAALWSDIVKIGRTHYQDATPLTLGQEVSGFVVQLDQALARIERSLPDVYALALGGTAVGTGINCPPGFAEEATAEIAALTGLPFTSAENKFAVQGSHDALVALSAALRGLAVGLNKIANDIRLLASGPRCGLGELALPENEPGSSIMPGKVNPTQCEALTMLSLQVIANDQAVALGGTSGSLQMNVYKPLIINALLQSIRLLSDGCTNFSAFLVEGMTAREERIAGFVEQSLMLVTALSPLIGYDKASQVAHHAFEKNQTLREACLELGYLDGAAFDRAIDPLAMTRPG
ncbi:MAG: class II fumarate hydratase [Pseudomonadota bacterium]